MYYCPGLARFPGPGEKNVGSIILLRRELMKTCLSPGNEAGKEKDIISKGLFIYLEILTWGGGRDIS